MRDELQQLAASCELLSAHKRVCTGESMISPEISTWPEDVESDALFKELVSLAYMLWREAWKQDIGFLSGVGRSNGAMKEFDNLIYALRTANQHTDNKEALEASDKWAKNACGGRSAPATSEDWRNCGRVLLHTLNQAVQDLSAIAAWVRRQERVRQAWRKKQEESVEGTVVSVAADLGLQLRDRSLAHHVRQVEWRWSKYRMRAGQNPGDVLASFAEAELISRLSPLPCSYLDILQELNALGSREAVPALLLAHGVAGASRLSGAAFVRTVATIWEALHS
jgi:hypothetical protein